MTYEKALKAAEKLAQHHGVHYAAATIHNRYAAKLGDLYGRLVKSLTKNGF